MLRSSSGGRGWLHAAIVEVHFQGRHLPRAGYSHEDHVREPFGLRRQGRLAHVFVARRAAAVNGGWRLQLQLLEIRMQRVAAHVAHIRSPKIPPGAPVGRMIRLVVRPVGAGPIHRSQSIPGGGVCARWAVPVGRDRWGETSKCESRGWGRALRYSGFRCCCARSRCANPEYCPWL